MKRADERSKGKNCETIQLSQSDAVCLPGVNEKDQAIMGGKRNDKMPVPARRAIGPRTSAGMQRSKYNATKFGIFSKAVLLKDESAADYKAFREGLWHSLQPVGAMEEMLVDQIVSNRWRLRRVFVAESAEIRNSSEFVTWNWMQREYLEAEQQARRPRQRGEEDLDFDTILALECKEGLIWRAENLDILDRCIALLEEAAEVFKGKGFSSERVRWILAKIYGGRHRSHLHETLQDVYRECSETAAVSEEERERERYATPEKCKERVLKAIDFEIARLKGEKEEVLKIVTLKIALESARQSVPDSPSFERLMRYEAALDRAFDRAFNRLERLQRMRLGQAVPPPLKVEHSIS